VAEKHWIDKNVAIRLTEDPTKINATPAIMLSGAYQRINGSTVYVLTLNLYLSFNIYVDGDVIISAQLQI
jgi:hypothetical protein